MLFQKPKKKKKEKPSDARKDSKLSKEKKKLEKVDSSYLFAEPFPTLFLFFIIFWLLSARLCSMSHCRKSRRLRRRRRKF